MGATEVASSIASENVSSSSSAEPSGPSLTPKSTLRRLAVQGSLWTIFGHGASEVLRFGGHLVVAHLVHPDVFGIMALVTVFMTGLTMFSDVGIGPSIVQDKQGAEPRFVNTAWTVQVIRGFALAFATLLLALPFSNFYYHDLVWLLPVAAIGPVLDGFLSTSLASLHRRLSIGPLTLFELGSQLFRVLASISFVLAMRSTPVLALIIGNLTTEAARLIVSHTVLGYDRNRLCWDRESARRLFRFGRWIFVSTALTFFVGYGDKLIVGKLFSEEELGIYVIAFFLAEAIPAALRRMAQMVLFPLYARLFEHNDGSLRREMLRMRGVLMALTLPPMWVLAIFGPHIVRLLYPSEYYTAGWILQILAMGTIVSSMAVTLSPVILAVGNSFGNMVLLITRSIILLAGMVVGYHLAGATGLVAGVAAASAVNYPVLAMFARRYGAWTPWLDFAGVAVSAVVIGVGLAIVGLPDNWGVIVTGGG